jgi:hypothetical protein
MAVETPCQTPGATYHVGIAGREITVWVELPEGLDLTEQHAAVLDANLHNAVELALAPLWARVEHGGER